LAFSDSLRRRFADVVQAHLDDAWRLARRIVGEADAEDVVQEAALRALKALETQTVASPRAWFLAIVRNAALTALARRGAAGADPVDPDDLEDSIMDPSADIEAALIARQESARVLAAVDALPLALRETLTLRDLNDLSYREIAAATGAPMGTVMSRLARARAALAKTLGRTP
jgi:RNA polymerase sigma factor (sigma-70 family)